MNVEQWTALSTIGGSIATGASAVIAVVAAGITGKQLGLARKAREDLLQPYVFVEFAISDRDTQALLWTVRNTGSSIGHNVRITFDPPLRPRDDERPMVAEWIIPSLAPGAKIRHFLDVGFDFFEGDRPKQHEVTVHLDGLNGPMEPLVYIADLSPLAHQLADQYPAKRIADKTEKIAKALDILSAESVKIRKLLAADE